MSYEWLNGVDSSINFGSQNNQNPYLQNVNNNSNLPVYNQMGSHSGGNQQMSPHMNTMPNMNTNSNRPLPNVPNVSNPQISLNSYNLQTFQPQQPYTNAGRPLPNIPQQQVLPNSSGGRPLPVTPEFHQQTLNQQFSGNNYQQPGYLSNSNNNSNSYLANTFAQAQGNSFMNNSVDTQPRSYQNTGLQDFEKIYGNRETSFGNSNNSSFDSKPISQQQPNFTSNPAFQAKPAEKFTPNYDRIDYNNTVSIFGKSGTEPVTPTPFVGTNSQPNSAMNTMSQTRTQRSNTNPFRNMQNSASTPSVPTFMNVSASNTQVTLPPPKLDDFSALAQRIPKSLGSHNISEEEMKNYKRWFNDIIAKKKHSGETIRLMDIFEFLHNNFTVSEEVKNTIVLIFKDIKQNIGLDNFFAVLRCLVLLINENGKLPTREVLMEKALPTLKPRSILAKIDDKEEVYEEVTDDAGPGQLDFDNFASLLMTGKSHRVKRVVMRNGNRVQNKSVRFSDKLVTYEDEEHPYEEDETAEPQAHTKLDFSLPMDQLMQKMTEQQNNKRSSEEEAELADMKESLTHFQNLPKVDTVSLSINGALPHMNFQQQNNENNVLQPLRPTATGSANYMMNHQNMGAPQTPQYLQPTATGSANHLFSSSGRAPPNMFNTSFGGNGMSNGGLNDLKSIQDQIDFISAQMTGGNNNGFK